MSMFDVSNKFYVGDFQGCINAAQKMKAVTDAEKLQRDVFIYRAYIAQKKFAVVLEEVPHTATHIVLRAVRLSALWGQAKDKAPIMELVESESAACCVADELEEMACVLYATIFLNSDRPEDALRCVDNCEGLEALAVSIHALLSMDRPDVAMKALRRMCTVDEDHTLTQLASAWLAVSIGKDALKNAFYIYEATVAQLSELSQARAGTDSDVSLFRGHIITFEMIDKHRPTTQLLVGKANVLVCQGKIDEAEKVLQEALSLDNSCVEALVCRLVCSSHAASTNQGSYRKQMVQLRATCPDTPFLADCDKAMEEFDRVVGGMGLGVTVGSDSSV